MCFSLGVLKYVVCLCKGCDGCCVLCLYCDAWSCTCSCMGSMSFVMQMLYICVLCASCGRTQCCILHDLRLLMLVEDARGDHMEGLQTTQPTSGGAVTVVSSCCANCVEPPRPQQWGPDLPFFGHAGHADPLDGWRCCSQKAGDVETNPGPTTLNKKVWICDICHKQIHVRKQISIRCNRIEHWVHLRCAGIRQAQYTDTWTCHLHT